MLAVFHNSLMLTVAGILAWTMRYPDGGMLNIFIKPVENATNPTFEFQLSLNELKQDVVRIVLRIPPLLRTLRNLPEELGGGDAGLKEASQRRNREHYFIWVSVTFLRVKDGAYTNSRANRHRCAQVFLLLLFAGLLVMTVLYFCEAAYLLTFLTEKAPTDQVNCSALENLRLFPGLTCGITMLESFLNDTIRDVSVVLTDATDRLASSTLVS
ncbi:unnamed protein product [Schistocephalus solidus]|uniref:Uncharacterized protein n=1 Tax=Schistocephalus solidus TaxID=70667 RepID=A0A183T304_SCHSO|nr:unnamed protein product [Schistocephalus solidus]